jgi:hypothetical protein
MIVLSGNSLYLSSVERTFMLSFRSSVVGPSALIQAFRSIALTVLSSSIVFSLACGHGSPTTTTTGVAPTFTSTPTQIAREGNGYIYGITSTTTDGSTVTYALTTGPTGATISGNTLSWTPTHAQSRVANSFTITATTSANGTATQTFTITPNGNIDGTAVDHAIADGTLVDYPQNLSATNLEVLLPDNKGGYNHLKGSGDASGNLTFSNVPIGSYFLHVPRTDNGVVTDNYIWTDSSDLDVGQLLLGRPDAVPAPSGVTVNAQSVGLSVPPTPSDRMRWVSPDANSSGSPSGTPTNPYSASFQQSGGLIDSSKGDVGYLLHYTTAGLITRELESGLYSSLTETNGGTVNLGGTLTANTGSTTDPNIKISTFDAINLSIPGFATTTLKNFTLFDTGYSGTEGFLPAPLLSAKGSDPIELISIDLSTTGADTDFGSVPYGIASTKGVAYAQLLDMGPRSFTIGGSTYTFQNIGQMTITNAVPSSSTTVSAVLGEPLNVTVDGKNFFTNQGSISLAPQVSWGPPSLGTPSSYELTVVNPATLGGATPDVHYFYTFANGVAIPPGILQPNTSYVFILQAMLYQTNTFKTAPFRIGTNGAWTSEVSGILTTTSGAATIRHQAVGSTASRNVLISPGANGRLSISIKK